MIDEVDSLDPVIPKVMYLDIEVNSTKVPKVLYPNDEVVCITCCVNDIYTTFIWKHDLSTGIEHREFSECLSEIRYFRSEEAMLQAFLDYVNIGEVDIMTGWNTSRFDLPYLINRMERLRIDYNKLSPMGSAYTREEFGQQVAVIKGISTIDLYDLYRLMTVQKQGQEESYKLDFIGKKVLGVGKTELIPNIRWLWRHNLEKLIEYNRMDTFLTVGIDQKMSMIPFYDELRRLCFCNLEDCLARGRMMDSYILRMFHGKTIFPSKTAHTKYEYEGATVAKWAHGIQTNVVVFDIRSLYPSIIWSFNLSPETYSDKALSGTIKIGKACFKQSPKGILPQTVETLFEERAKYKKLMSNAVPDSPQFKVYDNRQYALKTILNALYGQTAFPGNRTYTPQIAETITWVGRNIIKWSKDFLENLGHSVIYIDTDSCHFPISEIDIDYINGIRDLLNASYSDFVKALGAEKHIFEIEFEKIYRKAFYGKSKKRYAGSVCYKDGNEVDKLEIWGLETKRSDASQFTRKLMEVVLDMLLRQDKTKDEVMRYIGDEIDRLRKGDYNFTEIGIPKGITKELHEYGGKLTLDDKGKVKSRSGIPVNIRGAIYATKVLGHELSSKPKMIYILDLPEGLPKTHKFHDGTEKKIDSLCFDDDSQVPPGTIVDVEKMLIKTVRDKLEPIFEALDWKMSALNPWWRGKAPKAGIQEKLF